MKYVKEQKNQLFICSLGEMVTNGLNDIPLMIERVYQGEAC